MRMSGDFAILWPRVCVAGKEKILTGKLFNIYDNLLLYLIFIEVINKKEVLLL